jgi:uncharacterized protein (DUF58 family)
MISLLLAVLIVIVILFVLRILYRKQWDRNISVNIQYDEEYVYEGEEAHITEVVENAKILPLPVLEIGFSIDRSLQFSNEENSSVSDMSYRRDVFSLASNQRITRNLGITATSRGIFNITSADISASDILIREKYLSHVHENTELFVLPKKVAVNAIEIPFSKIMGMMLSRRKVYDDPFEFAGIREYQIGDPIKYINWKSTAKTEKLLVNMHDSTLSQSVLFYIDMESTTDIKKRILNELSVRITAALSDRLFGAGINVSIMSNGIDIITGDRFSINNINGISSGLLIKKKLAGLKGGKNLISISDVIANRKKEDDSLIIVLSSSENDEIGKIMERQSIFSESLRIIPFIDEKNEVIHHKNVTELYISI